QLRQKPGAVLPLERDFLVMDDERLAQGPVRNQVRHSSRYRAASPAAEWPLMTAPSMVAGRSLPIQSPARYSPGMAVRTGGRAGLPGATENVAFRSRTTIARRTTAARASGQADLNSSTASATSSS